VAVPSQYPIKELPFNITEATVHIDWANAAPVMADIKATGNVALEAAAGLRNIEIAGQQYRLAEVEPLVKKLCKYRPTPDEYSPLFHAIASEMYRFGCDNIDMKICAIALELAAASQPTPLPDLTRAAKEFRKAWVSANSCPPSNAGL
jgi:hypothetical protein